MRKAVMIVLALLAIRLLPGALRRQARALELITLLFQIAAAAAANTSKTVNTADRTASLETRTGNLERGQFSADAWLNSVNQAASAGPSLAGPPGATWNVSGHTSTGPGSLAAAATQNYVNALADNTNSIGQDLDSLRSYCNTLQARCDGIKDVLQAANLMHS